MVANFTFCTYHAMDARSIWPIHGTLTGTTTLGQGVPGSNDKEWILLILQSSRSGVSPSDAVLYHGMDVPSIWPIHGTLTGTTSISQGGPGSNGYCTFFRAPGCPRGVMVKAMDCGIVVREFVLQSLYYVHFRANILGKGMNPLSSQLWVK